MRRNTVLLFVFGCLQSCASTSEQEAKKLVYLGSHDLAYFSQLRQQLLHDSAMLWKHDREINALINQNEWMSVESYYLIKIDSTKYAMLFSKLNDKLVMHGIMMSKKGSFIFRVKEDVRRNYDADNDTYSHDIISADYKYPVSDVFNKVAIIYVDSVIDKNWRYTSYKVWTGH